MGAVSKMPSKKKLAGRAQPRKDHEVLQDLAGPRAGLTHITVILDISRVGSNRAGSGEFSKSHGSGSSHPDPIRPIRFLFGNTTSRIGSSRVRRYSESHGTRSSHPVPIRPAGTDSIREKKAPQKVVVDTSYPGIRCRIRLFRASACLSYGNTSLSAIDGGFQKKHFYPAATKYLGHARGE